MNFFPLGGFFSLLLEASHNGYDLIRVTFYFLTLRRITSSSAKPIVFTTVNPETIFTQATKTFTCICNNNNQRKEANLRSRGQMDVERRRERKI